MQTVVETPSYLADAERLFSPVERMAAVDRLAADPTCGVVIPRSGGLREKREIGPAGSRAQCFSQDDRRYDRELPETKMKKNAFDKIKAGLDEAKAYLDGSGDKRNYGIHVPARINVKKIRTRLGLSQESFAQTYGFALSAVRDWEQGRRQPERSARILLKVVEKEPEAVTRALAKTA